MDITSIKEDGIYIEENYRIPFECSIKTEYVVSNTANVVHSDLLDEAVQQSTDFEFGIKFYESSSFATEKTSDFLIGEMLYFEIEPTSTMIDQLDWTAKTCSLSHGAKSYAFYEEVGFD